MARKSTRQPNDKAGFRLEVQTPDNGARPEFDTWAIVEVMGHNTFAGRVTEQAIGGASFIRVDVPVVPASAYYPAQPAFTKLLGAGSIYAITPCSEEIARQAAARVRIRPIQMLELNTRALPAGDEEDL